MFFYAQVPAARVVREFKRQFAECSPLWIRESGMLSAAFADGTAIEVTTNERDRLFLSRRCDDIPLDHADLPVTPDETPETVVARIKQWTNRPLDPAKARIVKLALRLDYPGELEDTYWWREYAAQFKLFAAHPDPIALYLGWMKGELVLADEPDRHTAAGRIIRAIERTC